MSYEKRGSYNHSNMARQLLRFDGLGWGNVTPMDVDGLIEWKDKKRVLIEIKMKGVKVLNGERLALERMVNDFSRVGKESVFKADGKEFSGTMPRPHSGETEIVIEL